VKTSPKRSYSVIDNERFGLVFAKTVSIISGTGQKKEKRVRFPWVDVCHQWNTGKCMKAAGTCVSSRGKPLRHVCDFRDLANPANICGQAHKRSQAH
jgi:hypothetical protein